MKVKGTVITDLVKIVRKEKHLNWGDYLMPEDWEVINDDIMASAWYPGELFYRLSYAVFKVVGGSELEICTTFGKFTAHNVAQTYKNLIVPGDPAASMERFIERRKSFFSGDYASSELGEVKSGQGWLRFLYTNAEPSVKGEEVASVIAHSVAGVLQELASMTGAEDVSSGLSDKGGFFEINIRWK